MWTLASVSRLPPLGHGRLLLTQCSRHDFSNLCLVAKELEFVIFRQLLRVAPPRLSPRGFGCLFVFVGFFFFLVILVKLRRLIDNFWELQLPLAPCNAAYIWNRTGRRRQMENSDFNATEINKGSGRPTEQQGGRGDRRHGSVPLAMKLY